MTNRLKNTIIIPALFFCSVNVFARNSDSLSMNRFIDKLMSRMTLEEKIGQLNLPSVGFDVTGPILSRDVNAKIKNGLVGAVFNTFTPVAVKKLQDIAMSSRLHIPLLFGYDVIHGHKTIFPIPLALSATWDTALIRNTASIAADEATADGLNWVFSPMVDIARDPRWGRVSEGAGEDPWWGCQVAKAMIAGYQGDNTFSENDKVLACVKHFALYGAVEAGREYNVVDMSKVRMYNDYLPPYKAAIDAGAGSVMTSFNEINGVPATADKWLLTDLLRQSWGFKGFTVTDYAAIEELVAHGIGDTMQVAKLALDAGSDMDMVDEVYLDKLPELLKDKKISINTINAACRRIIEAKYKLGLFKDPYKYVSVKRAKKEIMSAEHLDASLHAAEESMVLLKDADNVLPLKKSQKVAFIGPMVKDKRDMIGNWSAAGDWRKAISIWEALQERMDTADILFARGCNLLKDTALINKLNVQDAMITYDTTQSPDDMIDYAVKKAEQSDVVVAVLGESFAMSGEAASRSKIGLPGDQRRLLRALAQTGKPVVLVLMNGRPLTLQWENDHVNAILEAWFPGTMGGKAIVNTLYGDVNPSGKITMSFPRDIGQIPIYYNHKNTGRPFNPNDKYTSKYLDVDNTPLYPFGYGLSYTSFAYSAIRQSAKTLSVNGGTISFSVNVSNTGSRDGEEVVEFYVRAFTGSITRPVQQLAGVRKVFLRRGESKQVSFIISAKDLKFYNQDLNYVNETGDYDAMIGGSSANVAHAPFSLVK